MAIHFLDRKVMRVTGLTGSNAYEFTPWNFSSVGLSGKTRMKIEWDITAISTNTDITNSYPNWCIRTWLIDYIPGSGCKLLQSINHSTAGSVDINWFESVDGSNAPYLRAQGLGTSRTFTLCGVATVVSCAEV